MTSPRRPVSPLLERLEAPLAPLDDLPRSLWLGTLTHSHGALVDRLDGVARLRAALVAGGAPGDVRWPDRAVGEAVAATFRELDLARFCANDETVTDLVLRSLLWHLDRVVDHVDRGASRAEATALALGAFAEDWRERCGELSELVDVLGTLGDVVKNARWDVLRGVLRSAGWQEVVRIRKLLERLPELSRVVRRLGRARRTEIPDDAHAQTVPVLEEVSEPRAGVRTVRVPDLPGETRGVRRSSRVARMLPVEAVLLVHPRLRLVWHARHAERTLLTYQDDDRMEERVLRDAPAWRPAPERVPDRRLELGPMLVCVDTSGSMQGGPEAVAKAVVLEAARTAHAQGRACHVFAFSGPGDVVDMPLSLDLDGVERLTRFVGQTFGGGTDVSGPLERVLEKLAEREWALADLLLVSDGEFGATPEVVAAVARAKDERGLRVQGVLVGDRETIGLLQLADDVFWVRDWRRYGEGGAGSPAASKSLTAAYFPGALQGERRDAAPGGDQASESVRGAGPKPRP